MPTGGFFTEIQTHITQLMFDAGIFQAYGEKLYLLFAGCVVVWFGVQAAWSGQGMDWKRFAQMMMFIAFGITMTRFYNTPIPGFGVSFFHLIVDEGPWLAGQIEQGMTQQVFDRLTTLYWSLETPSLMNIIGVIRWTIIVVLIFTAGAATFFVQSWGLIATAMCGIAGPLMLPFIIVPQMEWVAWGWIKSTLMYSMYPFASACFLKCFGNLLINWVDRGASDLSGPQFAVAIVQVSFLLIAYIWGITQIPSFCASMFAGRSGESVLPRFS